MKNTDRNLPLIFLKIINEKGKLIHRRATHKTRRIYSILEADNFLNCVFTISVKYPNGGKNEGEYKSKKELISVLKAFLEK